MLSQEVKEVLRLYLAYYAHWWKKRLTSREFRIEHWLAREQFYRQNKLPREINNLIEEVIWLDFVEKLESSAYSDFSFLLRFNNEELEERIRKLIEGMNKIRKSYRIIIFQIGEKSQISSSLKLYQEKLEEIRAGKEDQNWGLLIQLKNLANEEVNKETSFQWFLIFTELFNLLANKDLKRKSSEKEKITSEEWKQIQNSNQQALEKIHQDCQKTKRRKIEEYIQKLATNYLKKHPNLSYLPEEIITNILGENWRTKINENEINNIENEKRDYEVLFIKRSERFQRARLLVGLYLIGFVYIFFFYPFYLYAKLYRKHKIPFWANLNDLSKEQQKKDKEISYIVAKRFFIMAMVWFFFGVFFNLINERL